MKKTKTKFSKRYIRVKGVPGLKCVIFFAVVSAFIICSTSFCRASDLNSSNSSNIYKKAAGIGLETGYSALYLRQPSTPGILHGTMVRLRAFYGLSETFGIEFSGGMAFYAKYTPVYVQQAPSAEDPAENGDAATDDAEEENKQTAQTIYGDEVTSVNSQNIGLSLIYTFDVMRIIPYISMGFFSNRFAKTISEVKTVDFDLTLKTDFGADFIVTKKIWIGVLASFNTFLTEHSEYSSQSNFFIRATFLPTAH